MPVDLEFQPSRPDRISRMPNVFAPSQADPRVLPPRPRSLVLQKIHRVLACGLVNAGLLRWQEDAGVLVTGVVTIIPKHLNGCRELLYVEREALDHNDNLD